MGWDGLSCVGLCWKGYEAMEAKGKGSAIPRSQQKAATWVVSDQ